LCNNTEADCFKDCFCSCILLQRCHKGFRSYRARIVLPGQLGWRRIAHPCFCGLHHQPRTESGWRYANVTHDGIRSVLFHVEHAVIEPSSIIGEKLRNDVELRWSGHGGPSGHHRDYSSREKPKHSTSVYSFAVGFALRGYETGCRKLPAKCANIPSGRLFGTKSHGRIVGISSQ